MTYSPSRKLIHGISSIGNPDVPILIDTPHKAGFHLPHIPAYVPPAPPATVGIPGRPGGVAPVESRQRRGVWAETYRAGPACCGLEPYPMRLLTLETQLPWPVCFPSQALPHNPAGSQILPTHVVRLWPQLQENSGMDQNSLGFQGRSFKVWTTWPFHHLNWNLIQRPYTLHPRTCQLSPEYNSCLESRWSTFRSCV